MTDKRFIIIGDSNIEFIMQTQLLLPIYGNKERLSLKTCCDLLNGLYEENQQLERQVGNLEHTRDFCAEDCERLEKENEELKSEIREVRGAYEQLWMRVYDY